MNKENKVY